MIYIIFLSSMVIHEIGHLLMAKLLKINIGNVKFRIIGISAEFLGEVEGEYIKKVLILLIGPYMNLIISFMSLRMDNFLYKDEIILTNFCLYIFNFLPILPLDGGKVLFYILNLKYNFEESFKISVFISKTFLIIISISYSILIFCVKNVELAFIIFYLWYIFIKEEKNLEWYIKINKNMIKHLNLQRKCAKIPSVIK